MENTEAQEKPAEKLIKTADDMLITFVKLMKVSVVEQVTNAASASVLSIFGLVFLGFIMLFGGLGTAWWLGERMNDMKAGFFIVGGAFTALLLILCLAARKVIFPAIRDFVIRKIYENNN